MTERENKTLIIIVLSNAFLILVFSLAFLIAFLNKTEVKTELITEEIKKEYVYDNYLTRMEINDILKKDADLYLLSIGFYSEITDNVDVSRLLLDKAIEYEVPVNIAFALAFVESSFNIEAINDNGHSKDIGLFQLNERTFPEVHDFNLVENIENGLKYLKEQKEQFDSWEIAFILYNAGLVKNVGSHSLSHMKKVIEKEREYNEGFNKFRRGINNS